MSDPIPSGAGAIHVSRAEVCLVERDAALGRELCRALDTTSVHVTHFAGASAARDALSRRPWDVVIAGDDLEESACAALLRFVQHEHPEVVRVVLTEQVAADVFRRVPYAHQFVRRSGDARGLSAALSPCLELRTLIGRPELRALVSSSNALPAAPKLYSELVDLLADPKCSLVRVVEVIERDVAMSSRLMQLVSSAFFGLSTQITSLGGCVGYLGLNAIRSLLLSAEITRMYPIDLPGFSAERVHAQALATSRLARRIAGGKVDESQAFVAGLLHGVGQLVLASRAPERFAEALELSESRQLPLSTAELELFGATGAQVAAYLLALWGQPLEVVRAIAHQDSPEHCEPAAPGLATLIYISKRLGQNPDAPLGTDTGVSPQLSQSLLEKMGLIEELSRYRTVARRLAA
ncbi:MAG TPA: HDOD domain-containing protein [Polyangiaceae bacterium]|nr:HDOD domain-containing protein [Polyangiaceae bacterium]